MSFRQFGGINYAPKHNIVGSNYNTSNNLLVTRNIGQPNSYINFQSDISGNINVYGDLDVSGNLQVSGNIDCSGNITAYEMFITGPIIDNPQSVVPKYYVDLQSSGFQPKQACVCATTDNFIIGDTIAGNYDGTSNFTGVVYPLTIDDYVVDINDRILIKNQGLANDYSSVQNGIYYLSDIDIQTNTCTLTRTNDMAFGSQVAQAIVPCLYGTENKATEWVQTNGTQDNQVTVGVDPLTFIFYSQFPVNLGEGLISTTFQGKTTISVDPSLNFLEQIGNPGKSLNIGTTDTTLLFKNNEYNVTPYSIGPALSPPIVNIVSNTSSTSVTFTWSIPSPATTIATSLQTLNGVLYYCINDGTVKSYNIPTITSTTSPNNVSSTNSITVSSFSGISTSNNYYLEIEDFSSLVESNSNQLILWYSNYSPYPNVSYTGYSSFLASGTPSAVSFDTPSQPDNYNKLTVPVFVTLTDVSNDATGPPYIQSYQVFYNTPGSTKRYPEPLSSYQSQTFSVSPPTSADVSSNLVLINGPIFPDCLYDISSNAQNNQNLAYGPLGNYLNGAGYLTELPDYPTTTTPNPLFSGVPNYTNSDTEGYYLTTDTNGDTNIKSTPGIVQKSSTFPTSNVIITPVQQIGTVGNQSLSSSVTVTGTVNSSSSSVTVNSFGTSDSYTNSSDGIAVTSKTYDAYINDGSYNQGFYLDCSSNMNINSYIQSLNSSNSSYTATLSVTGNGVNPSSNYQFYVDDMSGNPSYTSPANFSINSNNNFYSTQVSGIWVLGNYSSVVFTVDLSLNNMGDYFYASPLVTYDSTGGVIINSSETNLSHVTSSISGGQFSYPLTIKNTNVSGNIVESYNNNGISLNLSLNNIANNESFSNVDSLSVITDYQSVQLANAVKTLNNLATSQVQGYRVWSAPSDTYETMDPSGIVPFVYIETLGQTPYGTATSDQGYIDISYNNTWDISNTGTYTNNELLIAAGNFTTNSTYYLDYSTYNGNGNQNTVNYSNLSGTKYATFAWNINDLTTNYSNLNFTITTASTLYQNSNDASYYFTNSQSFPLQLYFRYQTQTNFTASLSNWGESDGSYYPNTTWISFNASGVLNTNTTDYTIDNITNSANATTVYGTTSTTIPNNQSIPAGTSITFTVSNPTVNLQNPNASYLYLRIGIPNGYDAFNNVKAYLSSN